MELVSKNYGADVSLWALSRSDISGLRAAASVFGFHSNHIICTNTCGICYAHVFLFAASKRVEVVSRTFAGFPVTRVLVFLTGTTLSSGAIPALLPHNLNSLPHGLKQHSCPANSSEIR